MTNWFVYIVKCVDETFYTGVTTDLERRVSEHNQSRRGAKYTRVRQPVSLVYHQQFSGRSEAQIEESRIKKLNRERKLILIKEQEN